MADDWSREEVEAIVTDYFAMLVKELDREPFSKAEHNRTLQRYLPNRSHGSIEFKYANISAVMIALGYPYIDGYKPRGNFQELLRAIVAERAPRDHELQRAIAVSIEAPVHAPPPIADLANAIVPAPRRGVEQRRSYERATPRPSPRQGINYLEREARNRSLGQAGEAFVLRVEHERLWRLGERRLAERIEHVARSQGDGLGYDILSFEPSGRERMIEVKTTRYGEMTPFFASRNEVEYSESARDQFHLYRVYKFEEAPKIFILPGPLRESVNLEPTEYRASIS